MKGNTKMVTKTPREQAIEIADCIFDCALDRKETAKYMEELLTLLLVEGNELLIQAAPQKERI